MRRTLISLTLATSVLLTACGGGDDESGTAAGGGGSADTGGGTTTVRVGTIPIVDVAALYLGRVAADIPISQVDRSQVIELITAGRSGNLGIAPAVAEAGV